MDLPFLKKKRTAKKIPFFIGLGLFIVGVLGGTHFLYNSYYKPIDSVLGDDLWFYSELDVSKKNLKELSKSFKNLSEMEGLLLINKELKADKLEPWAKKKIAFGLLNGGHFVGAAKYKSFPLAQDFMNSFLLPEEALVEEKTSFGSIYTPSYSSQRAFVLWRGWLIWSNSKHDLVKILTNPEKLSKNQNYNKITKDLPKQYLWFGFVNIDKWDLTGRLQENLIAYRPLINSFGSIVPAFGITIELEEDKLVLNSKALTHKNIYKEGGIKISNTTVPDLAYFAPKNNLLFINGSNIFEKYKHTKNFLSLLDPQLSLVFEGVIQAQSNEVFGESFDYEKNVLSYLDQNYALLLDFENQFNFGFVAQIENNDANKLLIKNSVLSAQSRFEPEPVTIELPDGSERTELVAKDISTLPVEEKQIGKYTYYVVKSVGSDSFSYAFVDHYFVFANTAEYLEKMLETFSDQALSLATNRDFSQAVLFDFEAAESYGFVNFSKLFAFWDRLNVLEKAQDSMEDEKAEKDSISILKTWEPYLRNIVFSKSVYPGEVYIQGQFFLHQ